MGHAVALPQDVHPEVFPSRTQHYVEKIPFGVTGKKILFVTSEFADLIKVGGLGDVSAALPRALKQHDMRVLIPGYREVVECGRPIRTITTLKSHAGIPGCSIGRMDLGDNLVVYVVLCPELYERPGTPYGDVTGKDWADNPIRFARLSLAATEIAGGTAQMRWCPDLVHANDWPAALTPAYMKWRGVTTPSVFTIHNLAYQGLFPTDFAEQLGFPSTATNEDTLGFYGKLSFLKAGIVHASHVTTVSKNYAREITTPEFGCGLDQLLKAKFDQGLLSGITNGIDESWEPASDPHLVQGFCSREWRLGKQANARHVERLFGLDEDSGPLFAVVSRLVQQKGIDLTLQIADSVVEAGGRLVVIGRGEATLEKALVELGLRHPGKVGVHIGFNEADARKIFAGSDFLLMPSRFEPCGLSQMYAQRFGSLPIAHHTGGLVDTIEDGLNGFLFHESTADSYLHAIKRAFGVFRHPDLLNAMRCYAMTSPLFWHQSVEPYADLYDRLAGESANENVVQLSVGRHG